MFIILLLLLIYQINSLNLETDHLNLEMNYLNPSKFNNCLSICNKYHAGASINSTLVCTYQASGVGTLKQNLNEGTSCYPAYNCREDWNICIQKNKKINSLYNLSNETIVKTTCLEINKLLPGGISGDDPPFGGWKPTSLGWRKGSGNIGCGWGSTFAHVDRDSQFTLEDFGRVIIDNFQGDEVDCCIEAMKYEATDISHGGASIRFDLYNGKCRIDRELMMRGNLDTSSGRPLNKLEHCGEDGKDYFYWRPAAGAADAANLQSPGTCSKRYNFTKVKSINAIKPIGRLPDGSEIPNRLEECEGDYPEMCLESLRYNSINTLDECCQVCTELRWLPKSGSDNTPCVAFQIVDGKCRILRNKWFIKRYGKDGLGNNLKGNKTMSVTDVINVCSGFKDHDTCSRADDSHGYWGSCSDDKDVSIDNDCSYFSHIYFRDPTIVNVNLTITDANVTYDKVHKINLLTDEGTINPNLTISVNTTILVDRTTKRKELTNTNSNNLPIGVRPIDEKLKGYTEKKPINICSRISVYIKNTDSMYYDIHNNMDVFNPSNLINAIYTSNHCCLAYGDHLSKLNKEHYCQIYVNITTEFIKKISRNSSRRLSNGLELLMVYECIGDGKDLCDITSSSFITSEPNVPTPSISNVPTPSISNVPTPSISNVPTPSISNVPTPSISNVKIIQVNNDIKLSFSIVTIFFVFCLHVFLQ